MSILHKLGAFLSLSRGERRLLAQAWAVLLEAWLRLHLLPFRHVLAWAGQVRQGASQPADHANSPAIDDVERAVRRAAGHHWVPVRCLVRSLAMQRLLGQRGLKADLRIGVRKEHGMVQAHAWVEFWGRPVGEEEAAVVRFARLAASDGAVEVGVLRSLARL